MSDNSTTTNPDFNTAVATGVPQGLMVTPPAAQYATLEDVGAAGYVTEDWSTWQQGECDTYATALIGAHPQLRLMVIGRTVDPDTAEHGWAESHFVAHDDKFAYDSAGIHPLPYTGIGGYNNYVEFNHEIGSFFDADEFSTESLASALAHADRHNLLPGVRD